MLSLEFVKLSDVPLDCYMVKETNSVYAFKSFSGFFIIMNFMEYEEFVIT